MLGQHPASGKDVKVMAGRYGPYVSDGSTHATLPKGDRAEVGDPGRGGRMDRCQGGEGTVEKARTRRAEKVQMIEIQLQRLAHGEGLPAPSYATDGAAGLDVVAAEDLTLAPGQRHAVATGFAIAIPEGYEVQVRPRSGLALKHGITCLNTPGDDRP